VNHVKTHCALFDENVIFFRNRWGFHLDQRCDPIRQLIWEKAPVVAGMAAKKAPLECGAKVQGGNSVRGAKAPYLK
jgi:hypothetical protein